jgi:hypothetical protein
MIFNNNVRKYWSQFIKSCTKGTHKRQFITVT